MKTYSKQQYSGNENGWHEPVIKLGNHTMHGTQADELNSHFNSTGTFYEETDESPDEFKQDDEPGIEGPNLVYKDGKLVKSDKQPGTLDKDAEIAAKSTKPSKKAAKSTKPSKKAAKHTAGVEQTDLSSTK